MQDVGDQQFLVLLLVIAVLDLENVEHARGRWRGSIAPLDRRIDMGAIAGGHVVAVRPRDQATLRACVARAGGDVIGIEQKCETARAKVW